MKTLIAIGLVSLVLSGCAELTPVNTSGDDIQITDMGTSQAVFSLDNFPYSASQYEQNQKWRSFYLKAASYMNAKGYPFFTVKLISASKEAGFWNKGTQGGAANFLFQNDYSVSMSALVTGYAQQCVGCYAYSQFYHE